MFKKMKKLSLIIPCYNESKNLPLLLNRCNDVITDNQIEILIVDNGSTDNTNDVLNSLLPRFSFVKRVRVKENKGYGNGIIAGLKKASGEIIGWTHADMQTDPADALRGLEFFNTSNKEKIFVKGKRYGRPLLDVFFTLGMSIFETILLRKSMWDINAQPTLFHRNFFLTWKSPPNDFSLDLYAYFLAKNEKFEIKRFNVFFGKRAHGVSHWNFNFSGKIKFIKRTLNYSFNLRQRIKKDNA